VRTADARTFFISVILSLSDVRYTTLLGTSCSLSLNKWLRILARVATGSQGDIFTTEAMVRPRESWALVACDTCFGNVNAAGSDPDCYNFLIERTLSSVRTNISKLNGCPVKLIETYRTYSRLIA